MRKKLNKKGFTLIEIIGVVILIGIIVAIAVPTVSNMLARNKRDYYASLEETVQLAARDFFVDNNNYKPNDILKSQVVTVSTLIEQNNVEEVKDYKGNTCVNATNDSYVVVIKTGEEKFDYGVCLKCPGDDYYSNPDNKYCDDAWLTNDNVQYVSEIPNNDIYVYLNTQKELLRKKLMTNTKAVKYDTDGEVLAEVTIDNEEGILPTNINEVDTSRLGTTRLIYDISSNEYEAQVTVYQHNGPKVSLKDASGNDYDGNGWTNKVSVTLDINDEYFDKANVEVSNYQIYKDDSWKNVECASFINNVCTFDINENYNGTVKFRIVNSESYVSKETDEYTLKIDKDKPVISINPNGGDYLLSCSHEGGVVPIEESVEVNDSGESGIKYIKYGLATAKDSDVLTWSNASNLSSQRVTINPSGGKWYLKVEASDNASNTTSFTSEPIDVKIEILLNTFGEITSIQVDNNGTLPNITVPIKVGYTFKGYYTGENGTGDKYYNADGTPAKMWDKESCITLYAYFEPKTCNVSYNENGGIVSGNNVSIFAHTCTYGITCTLNSGSYFTKDKYKFSGWSTVSTAVSPTYLGGESTTNVCGDNDSVTLYAVWSYLPAPTCEIELDGTKGTSAWYSSDVNVTLTTTGTYTSRTLKIGGTTVSGTTGTVTANGTTAVVGTACNGTNCNTCATDVSIDKINPTVTISGSTSSYKKSHTLTLAYDDSGGSGLASTNSYQYYISTDATTPTGGSWTNYSSTVTVDSGTGNRYLFFKKILDGAGNSSTSSTYHISGVIKLDNTAPTINSFTYSDGTLTAKATDSHSGITKFLFKKGVVSDSDTWTSISATTSQITKTMDVTSTGTYYFYVEDALGNRSYQTVSVTSLPSTTAPTCTLTFVPTVQGKTKRYTDNNWYNYYGTVQFSSTEGMTDYYISTSSTATSGTATKSLVADQNLTTYYGFAKNAAGTGTCSIEVGIDTKVPTLTINTYKLCYSPTYSEYSCRNLGFKYANAATTYESKYVISDDRSQVRYIGQRYHIADPGDTFDDAADIADLTTKAENKSGCSNSNGKVSCSRTSWWNCYTQTGSSANPDLKEDGSGEEYHLSIVAIDNAGNWNILSSSDIEFQILQSNSSSQCSQ